jgi:putative N-acetylmannosamine-6-phosphate epimerase
MAVIDAGADLVALDCTDRPRNGDQWPALIEAVHAAGRQVLADVSTLDEGLAAAAAGADYVATTLSGYTDATANKGPAPDLALVTALAAATRVPVIAEGRYDTPALAAQALAAGAHAVVVGTAITNPRAITQRFVAALSPERITP